MEAANKLQMLKEAYKAQHLKDAQKKQATRGNYVYVKGNQQAGSLGPCRVIEIKFSTDL